MLRDKLSDLLYRLRALFRLKTVENELDEELRLHLERQVEKNLSRGMPRQEATRQARLTFGGLDQVKEECRDARGVGVVERVLQDLRYAVRQLGKSPGFTAVAVLTSALGIGATTAIFTVVHALVLKPLPYMNPERLVAIWETNEVIPIEDVAPVAAPTFLTWREKSKAFGGMAAFQTQSYTVTGEARAERVSGVRVSHDLFPMLGIEAAHGRTFVPEEDQEGAAKVVLLSHGFWQRRFGGDPSIVGRTLTVDGSSARVVGVLPGPFAFLDAPDFPWFNLGSKELDLWKPMAFSAREARNRGNHNYGVVGRLRDGYSAGAAQAELQAMSEALQRDGKGSRGWGVLLIPLHQQVVGDVGPAVWILAGAVAFVLLIACANLANLFLVRGTQRGQEIAIRLALGSGRKRLIGQLLVESLTVTYLGGLGGLTVAVWSMEALKAFGPVLPRMQEMRLDPVVLLFAIGVSLVSGVIAGLSPALHSTKRNLNELLQRATRQVGTVRATFSQRNVLIAFEVALSMVLLVGSGLLIFSLNRLIGVDAGFERKNIVTMDLSLPLRDYRKPESWFRYYSELLERVRAAPGVESAALNEKLPLTGIRNISSTTVEGAPPPSEPGGEPTADYRRVSQDYFRTMGIPLLRGRVFDEHDTAEVELRGLISQTMARRLWPGEDPLGKRFKRGLYTSRRAPWITVIGMVGDVRNDGLDREPRPQAYLAFTQQTQPRLTLAVRTEQDPLAAVESIKGVIWQYDPNQPIAEVQTMEQIVSVSTSEARFHTQVLGAFALLALLLGLAGIYSVISFTVSQRTHEMGIRMALGARRSDVVKIVLRGASGPIVVGVGVGLVAAYNLSWLLGSRLYEVSPTEPLVFVFAAALLCGAGLAGAYLPARRATKVDPMTALRYE